MGTLQWRPNGRNRVSNHQCLDGLLNRLFRCRSKKTLKPRATGFVRGIHRWSVNSPHKGPVTPKMFPFDDIIMQEKTKTCLPCFCTVWKKNIKKSQILYISLMNTLRPMQYGRHFADDIFKLYFYCTKILYFDSNCIEFSSQVSN